MQQQTIMVFPIPPAAPANVSRPVAKREIRSEATAPAEPVDAEHGANDEIERRTGDERRQKKQPQTMELRSGNDRRSQGHIDLEV